MNHVCKNFLKELDIKAAGEATPFPKAHPFFKNII